MARGAATRAPDAATWRVPARGPLEPGNLLAVLAAHAIPGIDMQDRAAGVHQRTIRLASRPLPVRLLFDSRAVGITAPPPSVAERRELDALVRWWFDLDTDPGPANRVLARDPLLGPLVGRRPGLRIVRYPDHFEAAATTVLGQQVSVAACRTFAGRLVARWGEPDTAGCAFRTATGVAPEGGGTGVVPGSGRTSGAASAVPRLFPRADVIAGADHGDLRAGIGITNARARTLQAVAEAMARAQTTAQSRVGPGAPFPLTRDELLALPGVGPWTADYLAVRCRADPDAFAPGDLVLRRALGGLSIREAAERAEAWRPHRAQALFHLWTAEANARRSAAAATVPAVRQ